MRQLRSHRFGTVATEALSVDNDCAGSYRIHGGNGVDIPIRIQMGCIGSPGDVNGASVESLLAIVEDAIAADPSCRENSLALTKVQEALHWLGHKHRSQTV